MYLKAVSDLDGVYEVSLDAQLRYQDDDEEDENKRKEKLKEDEEREFKTREKAKMSTKMYLGI